jgi:Ca2+-binding EF-hand superfamily protein
LTAWDEQGHYLWEPPFQIYLRMSSHNTNSLLARTAALKTTYSRPSSPSNQSVESSASGGSAASAGKKWWLPSTSELEDLKDQQRKRDSQLARPDITEAMLQALEDEEQIANLAAQLSKASPAPPSGRQPIRRAKSMEVVRQQVLRQQQLFQEQEQLLPRSQELKTANVKARAANKRRDCMISRNLPHSSRASMPLASSNHSTTSTLSQDSTTSDMPTSAQHTAAAPKKMFIRRTASAASSRVAASVSTTEIDAIIQQEKQLQKCYSVDWGVGQAETFVKTIQTKGKLWQPTTTTTETNISPSSPSSPLSWTLLEERMQSSTLQKAAEFKTLPKLKQAAFTLILSQLLTSEERQQLYHVYLQLLAGQEQQQSVSQDQAQQGYAKVFGSLKSNNTTTTNEMVMDYSEFLVGAAMASYHHHDKKQDKRRLEMISGESLRKAFAMFDAEGKGFISKDNLLQMCSHQDATSLKIIDAVMAQPDAKEEAADEHALSFADFVALFFGEEDLLTATPTTVTSGSDKKEKS